MGKLFLSEIFDSIQGETSLSGLMTSFVRLSGCHLRCSWCDSVYTFEKGVSYTFEELFTALQNFGWNHVCVTGGEPLLQKPVIPFMEALLQKGYTLSLETSGCVSTESVPEKVITILDIKCPGSSMSHRNLYENLLHVRPHDQVKFVLTNRHDYLWAKEIATQHALFDRVSAVLFSPAWGLLSPAELVSWIKKDKLSVRLNLQLHKFVWTCSMRGV